MTWQRQRTLRRSMDHWHLWLAQRQRRASLQQRALAWAVYSRKRLHHRRKYLQALRHWHANLLGACFAYWQQWIRVRRQRHAIFRRWVQRQQRRAIGLWTDFALCQSEYAALVAAADATCHGRLLSRVLRGWQLVTQHRRWREQTIHDAVCVRTLRWAARVWQHWAAYSTYRRAKQDEAGMALTLYHATLLKSIFCKWRTIWHVLSSARLALQATTLRLQMLLQLSCFRAWLAFAHTSLHHRHLLTSYLARDRKRRLRRLLRAWQACASGSARRRRLAATHHRIFQLQRGLGGFQAGVLQAKRRQSTASIARRFLVRSVQQRLWCVFCKWRESTDRKLRAKHALTFALATQTSSCVQYWHHVAQLQCQRRARVVAKLAERTTRTTWRVLHLWRRQGRLQRVVRRAGIEHRLRVLDHVFGAWRAYCEAKQRRRHVADDWVTSRQSTLATRVLTRWATWAHRRCRARTVVLRSQSLCRAHWERWRRAYTVATYFAWYRMRRVLHLWAAGTDLRRARRATSATADAFAVQRTLAFWHRTTRCAASRRKRLHAARARYETQLRRKLLCAWAQQCRRREGWWRAAVAFYDATLRRRHVSCVWFAWQAYHHTKKARPGALSMGRGSAIKALDCVTYSRILSEWSSHVRETRRLQLQCRRMGELLMARVVAQVMAAWIRFTATRRVKAEMRYAAIRHRNGMLQGVLFLDWWQVMSVVFATWRHCLLLRKTDRFRAAKEGRVVSACFQSWQTCCTTARRLRSCHVVIALQRDRTCCNRSFQAWRRWTTLQSLSYGARLAYCEALLSRVVTSWRHHVHVHQAAATVRFQSRLVLGQLALDLHATWNAWQRLFRARHWHRHATYVAVWALWRVYAADHKRMQTHALSIARRAATSLQARVLRAWHLHARHVVQLRRALVAKRQRKHVLTMHLRQRGRQRRQAAFTLWREAVLAARAFFHSLQRRRDAQTIAAVFSRWRGSSEIARRVHETKRHMASWRSQRALLAWHRVRIARAHLRVVLAVVDRWRRDQTLRKVWPRWAVAASRQKRLCRFTLAREQKARREAVRGWQYNIHVTQLATKSRLYARLRLLSKRFNQWRQQAHWLRRVRAFATRVTRQTWRRAYVRHWRLHTQRAAIETRKADATQLRRAARCHMRHLWRRWRSVALCSRACWWYEQTLTRTSMMCWRTYCIQEQSVRYQHAVASRRRLKDAWATWRRYQWKRLATAQARAFARFRRLQSALDAWLLGIETQAAETTAMEAAATALYASQLRRQHFRGWSHAMVRTKAQRQRHKTMVHTWQALRQERHLTLVWRAWARVSRRHRVVRTHRAIKHASVMQATWQHWMRYVEHQQVRTKQVHSAKVLWRDILLRRTLHHWHISVVASRAEDPSVSTLCDIST
ncbi:hypothetical protein SPRG_03718 [Saprolegnia parasitica CBS 223.65]|uniref:Sfi1 spindle body domain-containing protein n=1 Tax=Saprolegnia parasitica (strain CBS 223.65) TaxID=695850 RepID=A0A067CMT2_SAPPC|nr:hypothetical protein SPRG_03718 [Saprolegnia parasitica CBS 223.65]KDO31798.1 hypothetical protein SPRG_03718 [Saprolegnia parasitica CBS 223.65]|eukprot:XP_012197678.1 hypothetical protein SPRG_03718 [Saprolegnia parasitica CBS 223.65]